METRQDFHVTHRFEHLSFEFPNNGANTSIKSKIWHLPTKKKKKKKVGGGLLKSANACYHFRKDFQ